MTISKQPNKLDAEVVGRGEAILEGQLKDLYAMANALYEGLLNSVCPGDSTIGWSGHDHAKGGGPICRGVSHSADAGLTYLYQYTPTTARQKALIDSGSVSHGAGTVRYYGSPLFEAGVAGLAGRICYGATGSKFELSLVETSGSQQSARSQEAFVTLEVTAENEQRWIDLPLIPLNPGKWNHLEISAENESHDGSTNPTLTIYGIYITEAPGITRYRPSLLMSRLDAIASANADGLGFVAFETLDEWLVNDRHWLDADVLSRVMWFVNALYEATFDKPAPGIQTQVVRGHDHEDYGGLGITRNLVACFDMGMRLPWTVQVIGGEDNTSSPSTSDATWIKADRDTGSGGLRSAANVAHMVGAVSPGITNTGTSSAPYLDAYVFISAASLSVVDYSVRVAIYNRTQTAWSAVGVITTASAAAGLAGWVYIDEIPALGDSFNDFDVYVQCTKEPVTIALHSVKISESADVDGARVARLINATTTNQLGVAPNGVATES
jgi:hypothetical protein